MSTQPKPNLPDKVYRIVILGGKQSGKKYILNRILPKEQGIFYKENNNNFRLVNNILFETCVYDISTREEAIKKASFVIFVSTAYGLNIFKEIELIAIKNEIPFVLVFNNKNKDKKDLEKSIGSYNHFVFDGYLYKNKANSNQFVREIKYGLKSIYSFLHVLYKEKSGKINELNENAFIYINAHIMARAKIKQYIKEGINDDNERNVIKPKYEIVKEKGKIVIEVEIPGDITDVSSCLSCVGSLLRIVIKGKRHVSDNESQNNVVVHKGIDNCEFKVEIQKPFYMIPIADEKPKLETKDNGIKRFIYNTFVN